MAEQGFTVPEAEIREHAALRGVSDFATSVAIMQDSRLLVVRRSLFDSLGGLWELPGGGVEYGESFEQAAIREVREEVGLKIVRILGMFEGVDHQTYRNGMVRRVNLMAETAPGSIRLGGDHDESRWIHRHDLHHLPTTDETNISLLRAFSAARLLKHMKRYE